MLFVGTAVAAHADAACSMAVISARIAILILIMVAFIVLRTAAVRCSVMDGLIAPFSYLSSPPPTAGCPSTAVSPSDYVLATSAVRVATRVLTVCATRVPGFTVTALRPVAIGTTLSSALRVRSQMGTQIQFQHTDISSSSLSISLRALPLLLNCRYSHRTPARRPLQPAVDSEKCKS